MPRVFLAVALSYIAAACVTPKPEAPASGTPALPATVRVQVRDGGSLIVLAVPLDDYVTATILSEVDPPAADETVLERMYEVQAVISRTYAIAHRGRHAREGFDLCATTHCQLYEPGRLKGSKWTGLVRQATQRTSGEILWFAGSPARAVYHADCGGRTSSASEVWGGEPLPYLPDAVDGGAAARAHAAWTFEAARAQLRDALNADPRTSVGRQLAEVAIETKDAAGRAARVSLRGSRTVVVRGEVFRDVVSRAFGARSLRSTLFTVTRSASGFVFSGRGFGHGVGLCQAGAFGRLTAGATPRSVLAHYFPGTTLTGTRR